MKQTKILNNPITRTIAFAWCMLPNWRLKRKQRPYASRIYGGKYQHEPISPKTMYSTHVYTLIRADKGCMCGVKKNSKAIIMSYTFHIMDARNEAELKEFERLVRKFNLHFTETERQDGYTVSRVHEEFAEGYFWHRSQLPKGVRPILLMSNGSRVLGYWRRNGNVIELFRPNPNSAGVNNPLNWRIAHGMGLCYI